MRLVLSLTLPLFLLSALWAGEGVARPPILERRLALDFWGSNLNEAVRSLMEQTGVEIVFYRPDFPASQAGAQLYLVSGDITLRTALECLGRRYGFRYRLSESGRVELSKGYGWVNGDDFAVRFPRVDAIAGNGDVDALRTTLNELVKPLPLLDDSFSLVLSRTPNPDNTATVKAEAVLPPVLAEYFDKAIRCLSGEAGDGLRPASGNIGAYQARLELDDFLSRDIQVPRDNEVRTVLRQVARQAGMALMLETRPAATATAPLSSLEGSRASVGQVVAELSARLNLGQRIILSTGAVVLQPGKGEDWERDDRSREIFWTGLAVAGFDAAQAAARHGGGAALTAALRKRVFPSLWRDPVTAVSFSSATNRLAVIAPANVLEEIARFLAAPSR